MALNVGQKVRITGLPTGKQAGRDAIGSKALRS